MSTATYICKDGTRVNSDLIPQVTKAGGTRYCWTSFRSGLLADGSALSSRLDLLPGTYKTSDNAIRAAKRVGCSVA